LPPGLSKTDEILTSLIIQTAATVSLTLKRKHPNQFGDRRAETALSDSVTIR